MHARLTPRRIAAPFLLLSVLLVLVSISSNAIATTSTRPPTRADLAATLASARAQASALHVDLEWRVREDDAPAGGNCSSGNVWVEIESPENDILVSYTDSLVVRANVTSELDLACLCSTLTVACADASVEARASPVTRHGENEYTFTLTLPARALNQCKDIKTLVVVEIFEYASGDCVVADDLAVCRKRLRGTPSLLGPCAQAEHTVEVGDDERRMIALAAGSVSLISCLGMIVLYWVYPVLRKFPSNMLYWRALADSVFSLQLVFLNSYQLEGHSGKNVCSWWLAFLTQFCLVSSAFWCLALSLNFFFSIFNPFRRPQSKTKLYYLLVCTASSAAALVTVSGFDYRQDVQLCWNRKEHGVNTRNWGTTYIPLSINSLVPIAILIWGSLKLREERLKTTLETRELALRQTRIAVASFTVYYVVWSGFWWRATNVDDDPQAMVKETTIANIVALLTGMVGFADAFTWLYINKEALRAVVRQDKATLAQLQQFDDISDALRHEFIQETSKGICQVTNPEFDVVARGNMLLQMRISSEQASGGDGSEQSFVPDDGDDSVILDRISVSRGTSGDFPESSRPRQHTREHGANLHEPLLAERAVHGSAATFVSQSLFDNDHEGLLLECEQKHRSGKDGSFIAYAPRVFESLRAKFGVTRQAFAESFRAEDMAKVHTSFSEGKSGSFFYFSHDKLYMVKTLTHPEKDLLLEILPFYYYHMRDNDQSLICRFFGLFSINMYSHREYFVVMNNVLLVASGDKYAVDELYDLKGSSINRHGSAELYKDSDFRHALRIDGRTAAELFEQLVQDSIFLANQNIMDYSLLLGVHNCTEPRQAEDQHCSGLPDGGPHLFADPRTPSIGPYDAGVPAKVIVGPGIYHLGIIDLLQAWTFEKKVERWFKMVCFCHCHDWDQLSAVEPWLYKQRFVRMLTKVFGFKRDYTGYSEDELFNT